MPERTACHCHQGFRFFRTERSAWKPAEVIWLRIGNCIPFVPVSCFAMHFPNSSLPECRWRELSRTQPSSSSAPVPNLRLWKHEPHGAQAPSARIACPEPVEGASPLQIISPLRRNNDPQSLPFKSSSGTSSSRRIQPEACQQRPKLPVTSYPGRFCRELLCFHDFARNPARKLKKTGICCKYGWGTYPRACHPERRYGSQRQVFVRWGGERSRRTASCNVAVRVDTTNPRRMRINRSRVHCVPSTMILLDPDLTRPRADINFSGASGCVQPCNFQTES